MTHRVGVIGCGFIGAADAVPAMGAQSHLAAWSRHPRAEVVAVCDPNRERRIIAKDRWGVPEAFDDLEAMLRVSEPEFVSICSPDAVHADQLDRVMAEPSVRGVLAEKPLAATAERAETIVTAAQARGLVLGVNYSRRYLPSHIEAKNWLAAGAIGSIESVTGYYVGGLRHNGTHWLDLFRFLVGEPVSVRGRGPTEGNDPTIDLELVTADGTRATLIGLRGVEASIFEMDLLGTKGRLRLADGGARFEASAPRASEGFAGFLELGAVDGPVGGLTDLMWHPVASLVNAVETGSPPACTGDDAVRALQLAEAGLQVAGWEGAYVAQCA